MTASEAFEQQVCRIHELLDGSGAEVKWDDHIPDPDNASQQRQIDVTVRRDGRLTVIECRRHQTPQDVQWIEELIGRRTSLAADAIVAVSSSGFTEGALKKAERYGVIARDLCKLSTLEIESWGGKVNLMLYFYQYSDLEVSLCFEGSSIPGLNDKKVRSEFAASRIHQSLFELAANEIGKLDLISGDRNGEMAEFGFRLQLPGFYLSGERVNELSFRGKVKLVSEHAHLPSILGYGKPGDNPRMRQVVVEKFSDTDGASLGDTAIIHHEARIWIFLDVSGVEMPPFSQFRFFRVAGQGEIDHEAVELYGLERLSIHGSMTVNVCST